MAKVDAVVNFAAETHVDRSIHEAGEFINTDIKGTFVLLEAVKRYKISAFAMSGFFCGLAGVLLVARTSTGTARMGEGLLLESIAAIVMGGTALSGGVGGVHRTIIGVLVIAILSNGLNVIGIHPYMQIIIKGLVVVMAVAMTLDRSKIEFVK